MMTTVATQRTPFGDISNKENEFGPVKSKKTQQKAVEVLPTFENGPEQVRGKF